MSGSRRTSRRARWRPQQEVTMRRRSAWALLCRRSMNLPERPIRWAQARLRRRADRLAVRRAEPAGVRPCSPSCRSRSTSVTRSPAAPRCCRASGPMSAAAISPNCSPAATISTRRAARADLFWFGIWNTLKFVVLQVGLMVLFSLITALALNQKIGGRGFFRAAFFYPVLLSPVVVALIWKWMLARDGVLNAALQSAPGCSPVELAAGRALGVRLDRVRQHLGAYGVLHADPAGRAAGDPGGYLRGGGDGCRAAVARVPAASRCRC